MNSYIKLGDCCELLKEVPSESIDMILTSPPYDSLRNYNNSLDWNFEKFKSVASELKRVLKKGGVIVWVVSDQTKNGSESGSSFRQALYFKDIGLNLYDTMIFRKNNFLPLNHNRYEQEFEYMFVLSKGNPKTFNPIRIPCTYAGTESWGECKVYKTSDDELTNIGKQKIKDTKLHGNIWEYTVGSTQVNLTKHPAVFPIKLADDMVSTWTNDYDIVLDPFMGSGTTCISAYNLNRKYIGFEIEKKYFEATQEYLNNITKQTRIFEFMEEN